MSDNVTTLETEMSLFDFLCIPETRNIDDLDAPATTLLHGRIIRSKPFLRRLYQDFYAEFTQAVSTIAQPRIIVELGSGGSLL